MESTIPDSKPRSSSTAKGPSSSHDDLSRSRKMQVSQKGGYAL